VDCRLESGNLQRDTIFVDTRTVCRGGQHDHIACLAVRADFRARAPHVDYAFVGALILTSADVVIIDEDRSAAQHAGGAVTCRALHATAPGKSGPLSAILALGSMTSATFTMRHLSPGFASSILTP